ncbi:MAG: hypothetical protein M1821_009409 [Bathelium mastoideum]|nr:MAG: hypothetical protein M1821_009409 [Bathelium mastoideum]
MYKQGLIIYLFAFLLDFTISNPTSVVDALEPSCQNNTAEQQLASGILKNIDIQAHELAYVQSLQSMISNSTSPNLSSYNATKTSLLAIQSSGIAQRQQNQAIAPSGNAAIPGLNKVEAAQAMETALVKQLTGNPADDEPKLNSLVTMVTGGTSQNAQNRVLALGGELLQTTNVI